MSIGKNDRAAQACWGGAYDNIPKSVFALVAFHLANLCSENCDEPGAAANRFLVEISALAGNGIMDVAQAKRTAKAIEATLKPAQAAVETAAETVDANGTTLQAGDAVALADSGAPVGTIKGFVQHPTIPGWFAEIEPAAKGRDIGIRTLHMIQPQQLIKAAKPTTVDETRIDIGPGKSDNVYIEGRRNPIGTITSQAPASWDYEVHGSYGNRLGTADDKGEALKMIVDAWNQRGTEAPAPPAD